MKPQFHVYIDEAGDPGVKPKVDPKPHWTDWFVLSAVVVSDARNSDVVDWVQDMAEATRTRGLEGIHYRNLSDPNRERVCRMLARKPVRIFVLATHKDTMRKHYNPRLGAANAKQFYNWCLRLLLERVTAWCYQRVEADGDCSARIVFSQRGGHDYGELRDYLTKLEAQSLTGTLVLKAKGIAPGVISDKLCEVLPHTSVAGLQLADITASAFFQAANSALPRHDLAPAKCLRPRLARVGKSKSAANFGLLMLPFAHQGTIPATDRAVFEENGYTFKN